MATLSKGKQTGTRWKPIRFFRISLLDSGGLVTFSSPSLGISNMAVGDGSPGGQQRILVVQLGYSASWVGQRITLVAPRQSALLGQQRVQVGQLDILLPGINSGVSLSLLTHFRCTASNVRITASP
ncbi:hypothetical protein AVEN_146584-1 [Araneus ventricosus]|uniref:Uncharacterized protein n=1 Tax=Araneus ventricosus TaxID=182803 RepID=A0A4Y2H3U8_ARAVE|nr:hypothetical protein AVEN_146584-1 [Araneus ventricosus]